MYARYLQVNVCVGFSVCWGSKPVVALRSDHVSLCLSASSAHEHKGGIASLLLYRLLPYLPQVSGSTAPIRTIWIDAQRQSHRVRRSPVVKLR